ncbi:putative pop1-like nucleolar ribonuclease [Erysiphe necator]|uniref:Putative pop1-like nucleolar ribonuclease n=1 Tax=Uncinula necator TaxID=52586 RepID=A0A0B1P2V5_UNCNE|nr:putative pop1-like nucleolar ribonuclease [Erysiphe necator]
MDTDIIAIKEGIQVANEKVANEKVANEKVANEKVANEKVANEKVANEKAATRFATNKIVYTDNQAAARVVNRKDSPTSRQDVLLIRKLQREWKSRNRLPHLQVGHIAAIWIPSHVGVRGNELAE